MSQLSSLPLVCLKSAADLKLEDVLNVGKVTVIDFWTTKCTRCPAALDGLELLAVDCLGHQQRDDIQFVSICCDKLDGAREIIEKDDEPRWQHIRHFFMEATCKEQAKRILGFSSVPFYAVFDSEGQLFHKGASLDKHIIALKNSDEKENEADHISMVSKDVKEKTNEAPEQRMFVLDELDF